MIITSKIDCSVSAYCRRCVDGSSRFESEDLFPLFIHAVKGIIIAADKYFSFRVIYGGRPELSVSFEFPEYFHLVVYGVKVSVGGTDIDRPVS